MQKRFRPVLTGQNNEEIINLKWAIVWHVTTQIKMRGTLIPGRRQTDDVDQHRPRKELWFMIMYVCLRAPDCYCAVLRLLRSCRAEIYLGSQLSE